MPGSTYSVHLNDEDKARFEEQVVREGRLKSDLLRDAVREYLEKRKLNTETTILPKVV